MKHKTKTHSHSHSKQNSIYSVLIKCKVCGDDRWVKPQDATLVQRCKVHQRARTLQLRRERAAKTRAERAKKLKTWRSQVQSLAKRHRFSKDQFEGVLGFFEQVVGQVGPKTERQARA